MKTQYAKISRKRWFEMTPQEQEAELRELDKSIDPRQMKPLSKKQRILWERMRSSKPDISIMIRDGQTDVIIRLDEQLMQEASAFARKNKTTLPKMIDRGLRGLLAFSG